MEIACRVSLYSKSLVLTNMVYSVKQTWSKVDENSKNGVVES